MSQFQPNQSIQPGLGLPQDVRSRLSSLWGGITTIPSLLGAARNAGLAANQQQMTADALARAPLAPNYVNVPATTAKQTMLGSGYSYTPPVQSEQSPESQFTFSGGSNATGQSYGDFFDTVQSGIPQTTLTDFKIDPPTDPVKTSTLNKPSTTYQDLLAKIQENVNGYQGALTKSAQEQEYEQNLLAAINNQKQFQLSLQQGKMDQYGYGRPLDLATGRAAQLEFNNQFQNIGLQNQTDLAQRNLAYEQQNRQLRGEGLKNQIAGLSGLAGLYKPMELQPGTSLIDPVTGQSRFQNGAIPPSLQGSIQSYAKTLYENGLATDLNDAMSQATNYYAQQYGIGGGSTAPGMQPVQPMSQTNLPGVVAGYDLAAGIQMAPYATDAKHTEKIASIVSQMPQNVFSPAGIDSYIKSVAPNSPLAGTMVYNAAMATSTDPRMLLAVMQNDSAFGTKGAGAKTFNPGNVGNTDSGATVNFGNWQSGIMAVAQNLAKRRVNTEQLQQLPPAIQTALNQVNGQQYLDQGNLTTGQLPLAQTWAARLGVPLVSKEDAFRLKDVETTFNSADSLLQTIQSLAGKVITAQSPSGIPGQFVSRKLGSLFRTDSDARVFEDTIASFSSLLTRAAGEKGVLTNQDVERIKSSLPNFLDDSTIATQKLNSLRALYQSIKSGAVSAYLGTRALAPQQNSSTGVTSSGLKYTIEP